MAFPPLRSFGGNAISTRGLRPLQVAEHYRGLPQGGIRQCTSIQNKSILIDGKLATWDFDFVVMASGELRLGNGHYYLSEMSNEVMAAGRMGIDNWKISYLDDWSGHYLPTPVDLANIANRFSAEGLMDPAAIVAHCKP